MGRLFDTLLCLDQVLQLLVLGVGSRVPRGIMLDHLHGDEPHHALDPQHAQRRQRRRHHRGGPAHRNSDGRGAPRVRDRAGVAFDGRALDGRRARGHGHPADLRRHIWLHLLARGQV